MTKEHPAEQYEELHLDGGVFFVATVKNFTQTGERHGGGTNQRFVITNWPKLTCNICGKQGRTSDGLCNHKGKYHNYECNNCGKQGRTRDGPSNHKENHHP